MGAPREGCQCFYCRRATTSWQALAAVLAMIMTGIVWGGESPAAPGSVGYILASLFFAVALTVCAVLLYDALRRRK